MPRPIAVAPGRQPSRDRECKLDNNRQAGVPVRAEKKRHDSWRHKTELLFEALYRQPETTKAFLVVRQERKRQVRRRTKHYNLDAIISGGYRSSSKCATQFRQWATQVLKDHLVKGYTLNQRRLAERGIEFEQALDLLSRTLLAERQTASAGLSKLHGLRHAYNQQFP